MTNRSKSLVRFARATTICLALAVFVVTGTSVAIAHDAKNASESVSRELLAKEPLPELLGHVLTSVTVKLAPGAIVGPHRHGGFVYVYLLQGRVRSQLDNEPPNEYVAGQSWVEPAGVLHRKTENPSTTEPAKFLAVIIGKSDAVITQPEDVQK